jgi:hypothetical protein
MAADDDDELAGIRFDAAAEAAQWLAESSAGISDGRLLEGSSAEVACLILHSLEGTELNCHLSSSGVQADDGRAAASLHELLMASSPAYGRWYLTAVAARLCADGSSSSEDGGLNEGALSESPDGQQAMPETK